MKKQIPSKHLSALIEEAEARMEQAENRVNEMRISELRYRRLFESAKDGILILDAVTGMIMDVNPFLIELLGFSRDLFLGKKIWELGFFKDIAANEAKFAELQEKEYVRYEDLPLETADGRRIAVEFVSNVYQESEHKVIQCNIRDVSARKHAEEVIRTSEQLIDGILNSIPASVFWKDRNSVYLGCNALFAHDMGFANPKEIIGKDDFQLVRRAQADSYRSDDRNVIESGISKLLFEEGRMSTEGDARTVLTSKVALRNTKGEIFGVLGTYLDITDRKQEEEELQNLRTAVEQSASAIIVTDPEGTIEYANPAFEKASGYTAAEVIGQSTRILKSGEHSKSYYRELWSTISSGKSWQGEFHNKRKDGSLYWEQATISPVLNQKGAHTHYIAVKEDITASKSMEADLKIALDRAEAGNRAKSEFLAVISHELRTPLNGILGFANLSLEDKRLPSDIRDNIAIIESSGSNLLRLLEDILAFSQIEGGRLKFQSIPFSLSELGWKAIRLVETGSKPKNIQLFVIMGESVPGTVLGDPDRIQQVLLNLLRNAVKFTEKGTITLSIRLAAEDGDSYKISFAVEDTGLGIPESEQEKIFLPFTQGDSSMTRKYDGVGMGLAISRRLVEEMGSTLSLKSEAGIGSLFSFDLSLLGASSAKLEENGGKTESRVLDKGFAKIFPSKILIVEDNPINLRLAVMLLGRLGYEDVATAGDGGEALALLEKEKVDLIFMDLQMPGIDGLEATRKIRALETDQPFLQPRKIVALTANTNHATRNECFEAGMDHYISKPFNTRSLAEAITLHHCAS